MIAGQKSRRANIQDILIPMENFRCLQGDFEGNHPWYAVDLSGKDTGRDLAYAPVDVRCEAINEKDGNAVWWQSIEQVRFPDGTIDFLTMMILHDDNLKGIYIGATYRQGEQIAQEGTSGLANGNHLHIEFAKGKFTQMYEKNAKGYYLPKGIAIENVCFADKTNFITSANWDWKFIKDIPVHEDVEIPSNENLILSYIPSDFMYEDATFICEVDKIRIRKAPSLTGMDTGLYYEHGMSVHYEGYVKREGYVWISWISAITKERRWMAVREIVNNQVYGRFC